MNKILVFSCFVAVSYCSVLNAGIQKDLVIRFGVKCPGGEKQCPNGETCCPSPNGSWACCPTSDAVCCSDKVHCCPHGYKCVGNGQCIEEKEGGITIPWLTKHESFDVLLNICPDGKSQCSDSQTCCPSMGGGYSCCTMSNAVCCPDQLHCCPSNTVCDTSHGKCTISFKDGFSVPMTKLIFQQRN